MVYDIFRNSKNRIYILLENTMIICKIYFKLVSADIIYKHYSLKSNNEVHQSCMLQL